MLGESALASHDAIATSPGASSKRSPAGSRVHLVPLGILLLICAVQLPVFLQLSLTPDTVLYDLQSQCLREGGVLYRDIVEPNLPGVVWVHSAVRMLAGPSSIVLRVFDFGVVLSIALLLTSFLGGQRRLNVVSLLMVFYFGTSEWCHCQRDTWMLLPCLLAVLIRRRIILSGFDSSQPPTTLLPARKDLLWSFVEGVLWAAGFWLKPFVAVPAILVLLISRYFQADWRAWRLQMAIVLLGGLVTGIAGISWMMGSGCWPHFVEMLTTWNGDYFQAGRSRWTFERFAGHCDRFLPWIFMHVPAIFLAARNLLRTVRRIPSDLTERHPASAVLLSALYSGWLIQAFAFQQMFDYVHVPGMILAIAICWQQVTVLVQSLESADSSSTMPSADIRRLIVPTAMVIAVQLLLGTPALQWGRLQHWPACIRACLGDPLAARTKDEIAMSPFPRWQELHPMLEKLAELNPSDTTVMAYNGNLIHLYSQLQLHSPTRFVYLDVLARCFPNRRPEMLKQMENSNVKYVLSDLVEDGWEKTVPSDQLLPSAISRQSAELFFPYNQKPIYRSGGYVLFEMDRAPGWLTSEYSPLASITRVTRDNKSIQAAGSSLRLAR